MQMTRVYLCFAVALVAATPGLRAESEIPFRGDKIAVPADSPIHFSKMGKKYGDEEVANFPEKFLLTGTYYYGDNDFNDSGYPNPAEYLFDPEVYIVPDREVAARLPHFVVRNRQHIIFLDNPEAFAKAVVPRKIARRVRCSTCSVVTGHIAIWVDQFTASIACDKPEYGARFVSVDKPANIALVTRPGRAC